MHGRVSGRPYGRSPERAGSPALAASERDADRAPGRAAAPRPPQRVGTLAGLGLIALTTLMLELALMRAFDVILTAHMAYMVITFAMFSFGLAGVYGTLRPLGAGRSPHEFLAALSAAFGVFAVLILPAFNVLPFDVDRIAAQPVVQTLAFGGMYLALMVPFFLAGLVFTTAFSEFSGDIHRLYFWDLTGAAVGCVLLVPFIPLVGPGGLLFVGAALALIASGLFTQRRQWRVASVVLALVLLAAPFVRSPGYFDFREHMDKRGVKEARESGAVELTRWDPISKIDVIDDAPRGRKHVAYDGGEQSSHFYEFSGDFAALRASFEANPVEVERHFWMVGVTTSHHLRRDQDQRVLVLGSAGGQEIKAALTYGASRVVGVEMVGTVIDLGKSTYADYIGGLFDHPRVSVLRDEGRSVLRASRDEYDIIQIFSNHTTSSIAAGASALSPVYLQTVEAYREYFARLAPAGVLQVNHHVYPRMVTTAAQAWRELGRSDFRRHVMVFEHFGQDNLPTLLIKMTPWTVREVTQLEERLAGPGAPWLASYRLVENPFSPETSFLSDDFYSGELPRNIARLTPYRVAAVTDDRPFFNLLRKRVRLLEADEASFLNTSTAALLNSQLRRGIVPMDLIHLIVTAILSILFAVVFMLVPLFFAGTGRTPWEGKAPTLLYFACLGAGFIIIELVLIQMYMKLIGFPLYTYSVVIFTMLLGAGIGSRSSVRLGVRPGLRWWIPFAGILVTGGTLLLLQDWIVHLFLASALPMRIGVAVLMLLPISFFLGMPFPLGIAAIEHRPRGTIAWGWAMNGLFTVIGGLLSVLAAASFGFRRTFLGALGLYAVAFLLCQLMMRRTPEPEPRPLAVAALAG